MYCRQLIGENSVDFSRLDIEASPDYAAKLPATITVAGYSREFHKYLKCPNDKPNGPASHRTPIVSNIKPLLNRIAHLKSYGLEVCHSSGDRTKRISALSSQLNQFTFEYCTHQSSVALAVMIPPPRGIGFGNFIYQILLAYELYLRLDKTSLCTITDKVLACMFISQIWIQNVEVTQIEKGFKMNSLVHEGQIESLLQFAEILKWPHLDEARHYVENVYSGLQAGQNVPLDLWDWLFGIMLPGRWFASKVMTALVLATPSTKSMGPAYHTECGLVLPDQSYWRSTTALGKVLGGLVDVKAISGWIGPCMRPESPKINGWITVRTRGVAFPESDESNRRVLQPQSGEDLQHVEAIENVSNWVYPPSPAQLSCNCTLNTIQLKELPPAGGGRSNSKTATEYQATITLGIDAAPVTYTLYTNPLFITSTPCSNGQHPVHPRELFGLNNVWDVQNLKNAHAPHEELMIINATCDGGELVGRAWCSEMGRHAVVRRGNDTCFACAVELAGNCGLGVGVLIWS
jgi:hypothetical protein